MLWRFINSVSYVSRLNTQRMGALAACMMQSENGRDAIRTGNRAMKGMTMSNKQGSGTSVPMVTILCGAAA